MNPKDCHQYHSLRKSPVSGPDSTSTWLNEAVRSRGGLLGTKLLPAAATTEVKYSEPKAHLLPFLGYHLCLLWCLVLDIFRALWEPPPQDIQEVKSELFSLAIFHRK